MVVGRLVLGLEGRRKAFERWEDLGREGEGKTLQLVAP